MSRIGKKPIPVPTGVTVTIEPEVVRVAGPRGDLFERKNRSIDVKQEGDELIVTRPTDRAEHRALHGLTRSLVANMVEGVTSGFTKTLEIQGVGYRAQLKGRDLELALGYSHPVPIKAPEGIEFEVPVPTRVIVKGNNKQQVGEIAAIIRKQRKPEPYKGKGIRYEGEYVARRLKRRRRVRAKVRGSAERPRVSVFRSNRGIFAQLIDDDAGRTLAAVNWTESDLRSLKPLEQASKAGELLAERAKAAGIETAVFDRGGYRYHGRVKALAEGAREGGLNF
jgi:large subunit ribosomal protein L6